MNKSKKTPTIIKYIGNSIKRIGKSMNSKNPYERKNGIIKHQPSWMYRNE